MEVQKTNQILNLNSLISDIKLPALEGQKRVMFSGFPSCSTGAFNHSVAW